MPVEDDPGMLAAFGMGDPPLTDGDRFVVLVFLGAPVVELNEVRDSLIDRHPRAIKMHHPDSAADLDDSVLGVEFFEAGVGGKIARTRRVSVACPHELTPAHGEQRDLRAA
jgi:hypothetical protein